MRRTSRSASSATARSTRWSTNAARSSGAACRVRTATPYSTRCSDGERRDDAARGAFEIEIEHFARATQHYVTNTAILVTDLFDRHGHGVRITDFAPRLRDRRRVYRPLLFIRRLAPLSGRPRVRIRVRPGFEYGAACPEFTRGSNHIRYVHPTQSLRLTCDMPVTYILDETFHQLDRPANLIFGVDETIASGIAETARDFEERTAEY
ncbi:MAG: hypothetical protein ACREYD_11910 [Casimicrobiaceae bacterium]